MTITEKGLIKLLKKYFMELEPIEKDAPVTTDVKMITGPSGLPEAQVVQEKADKYMEEQLAISLSTAIGKAIHPQIPVVEGVTPWFEWNGEDLSQFDSAVVGSAVTGHSESVITYRGFKWINMSVSVDVTPTGIAGGVVLPISETPPSADYVIAFEFVSIQVATDTVGAAAVVRFVDKDTGYWVRYNNRAGPIFQDFGRFDATEVMNRFQNMGDPNLEGLYRGSRLALSVQEGNVGTGALVKMIVGEPALYIDGSPHTGVGKAGLFQTTSGVDFATTRNYYRNIRCYRASDVDRFLL